MHGGRLFLSSLHAEWYEESPTTLPWTARRARYRVHRSRCTCVACRTFCPHGGSMSWACFASPGRATLNSPEDLLMQLICSAHITESRPDRDWDVHFRRALVARDPWRASSTLRGKIRRDRCGHVLHGLDHGLLMARKLYLACPFSSGTHAHAFLKASPGPKWVDVTTPGLQPLKQYSGRPAARRYGMAKAVRHACRIQLSGGGELCCPLSAPLWSINGHGLDQIPTSHSDVP